MKLKHKHYFAAMISAALLLTGCQQKHTTEPEQDTSTQTLTETQQPATKDNISTQTATETQTTTPEHIIITQTFADTGTTVQDTSSLSNIVRCESIKLPDDIRSFDKLERSADGFRGIVCYGKGLGRAYLHISEDMQMIELSLLNPPENQGDYTRADQWFALGKGEIWSITRGEKYLLSHYAEDGTLLSAIPINDFQDYQIDYRINESFVCVGDVLYMTLPDGSVLQIDKKTAEVSGVMDLRKDDTYYNYKLLCFDRDDKPVLLQEKVSYAPDKHTINEAVVSEFDLESCSCGQTIYTAGDNWNKTKISVLKGCGEYRFFINTYSELIGIKDDGTQDLLIDIDSSDLDTQIMIPDDYYVPYTNNLFDINIIPVDETRFWGLYEHYPECITEAFRLTRKHESEIT